MSRTEAMRDWSIDLETLDNRPTSVILSIGAVLFDRDTGELGTRVYYEINLDDAMAAGTVSGSTLSWWMQQGDKARRVFGDQRKVPLRTALEGLATSMRATPGPRVWGNGSSFDISILEHAWSRAGGTLELPWKFWDVRDMRTTIDDAGIDVKALPRVGTHHNALDDAEFQAIAISLARRRIRAAIGYPLEPWKGPAGRGDTILVTTKSPKALAPAPAPTTPDEDDEL